MLCASAMFAVSIDRFELRLPAYGDAFPPGRRFAPNRFWTASPSTQDSHPTSMPPHNSGGMRSAADFVASGEAAMLAWSPPAGAKHANPLADTMSLVRVLGGLGAKDFPKVSDVTYGDVVNRNATTGQLNPIRWDLVFSRLDPYVLNGIAPIVVLDNVPWAFAPPGVDPASATYGQNFGPANVSEYGEFVRELLAGLREHYSEDVASGFWFRVGTEPDTQPGHWNDTNAKYAAMYVAVAEALEQTLPRAKLGPGNFASDGPMRADSWNATIVPMTRAIVAAGARIDFLAASCYGRAIMCGEPKATRAGRTVDHDCELSAQNFGSCVGRLAALRAELLPPSQRGVPMQIHEYGLQQNALGIVDPEPGAWGSAWTLMSSATAARAGVERAFHWGFADRNFGNGDTECRAPLSPCGLYGGSIFPAAAAGHLFGANGTATLLDDLQNRSAGPATKRDDDGGPVASGIGGWGATNNVELRLLVSLFAPRKDEHGASRVLVSFERPDAWGAAGTPLPPMRSRVVRHANETSVYDAIRREAAAHDGWLANANDPNVYPVKTMLTAEGRAGVKAQAQHWLAMQQATFTPSEWAPVAPSDAYQLSCGAGSGGANELCQVAFDAAPPTTAGLWFAPVSAADT